MKLRAMVTEPKNIARFLKNNERALSALFCQVLGFRTKC